MVGCCTLKVYFALSIFGPFIAASLYRAANHLGPKTVEQLKKVYYMDHICSSSKSFTKRFNYSLTRGAVDPEFVKEVVMLLSTRMNETEGSNETTGGSDDVRDFLRAVSLSIV